ncbi:related to MKT1 - retroviral protease signature protein [Melanopsichium pennsylvanicum]|uniref:Related to MKT1 - retroviral protease signature protein n=2 Tax=Melanopsichium pennsylvanicum TaxID=63383 RepID=A0AAJ4XQ31_9BASI|nr:related to MKT1-retroviral protease signature protein [Melanopsichium pennsylvanicum 4]SNX85841.1 related to MKT1 - retroviral protease signature protein [Melanopsichium pennsylvanicum]
MIRGLQALLHDRGFIQTSPLSALKDTRLGIDLSHYLKQLLSSPSTSEPLVAALGGAPIALISHIENDLRALEKARIKPVFILNGLPPNKRSRPFSYEDPRVKQRHRAWDAYENGQVDLAHSLLSSSTSLHHPDLYRAILRVFRHRNVEFLVAPYLASAQLVSLERHSKSYIHSIYGATEILLYDRVDKLITSLNLSENSFHFVSKSSILNELRCNEEHFLDIGLLAGSDLCATFPALQDASLGAPPPHAGAPPNLRHINQLVKQYKGGYPLVAAFEAHPHSAKINYADQFCRARTIVKFCLVLSAEEGRVLPLPLATPPPPVHIGTAPPHLPINGAGAAAGGATNSATPILTAADVPVDIHEVFSHRLPDEVFLHLSRGLVGPSVLSFLTSGHIIEAPPLDNGESEEYRRYIRETLTETPTSPRCVAVALASSVLNGFWSSRKISAIYFFSPTVDHAIAHDSAATLQLINRTSQWNVSNRFIEEELRRQNSSTIDIALCLGATTSDQLASRTKTPRIKLGDGALSALEKKDEIVANTIWRMLELRGFLNHAHTHTAYARALYLALKNSRLNDKLQEPLYLALEMIRGGVLHAGYFGGRVYSGGPSWGDGVEKRHMLLVMRTVSLLHMTFKPESWTAPLSRELLVFNSFVKATSRAMRNLVEMLSMSLLVRGDARRSRDDYLDISLSLPFQTDVNTGMGIVVKCYLDGLLTFRGGPVTVEQVDDDEVVEAKHGVLHALDETFANVRDVRAELGRSFRFWSAVMEAVGWLEKENAISGDVAGQFRAADTWLGPLAKLPA